MGVVEQVDSGGEIVIRRHRVAEASKGEYGHAHAHAHDSGRGVVRVLEPLDQGIVVQSMTMMLW